MIFGNFVIGSGALAFIGMLDSVSNDLRSTPAAAGQIAGLYSLGICVSGPILGAWTSRYERRCVLAAALALFALGHARGLRAVCGLFAAGPGVLGMTLAVSAALLRGGGNFSAHSMQPVRLVNLAPDLASRQSTSASSSAPASVAWR